MRLAVKTFRYGTLLLLFVAAGECQQPPPQHETVIVTGTYDPIPLQESDRNIAVENISPARTLLANTFVDFLKLDSSIDLATSEARTVDFLAHWVPAGKSPMCGNSICQDRRFLHRLMPRLEAFFHYRNLDVSTIKELARRWAPDLYKGFTKESTHTALSDTRDSIAELRYYRPFLGRFAGSAADA